MTFLEFLPCLEAMAVLAILPIAFVLIVSYFQHLKQDRLGEWRAIGLTPQIGPWQAWDTLAGDHRGRTVTMSWDSRQDVTRFQVSVKSPSGSHLTIMRKWPTADLPEGQGGRETPSIHRIEDLFLRDCDPPHLATTALSVPLISAVLSTDAKSVVELKGGRLRLDQGGYLPNPQHALRLLDSLCDLADLIDEPRISPSAA